MRWFQIPYLCPPFFPSIPLKVATIVSFTSDECLCVFSYHSSNAHCCSLFLHFTACVCSCTSSSKLHSSAPESRHSRSPQSMKERCQLSIAVALVHLPTCACLSIHVSLNEIINFTFNFIFIRLHLACFVSHHEHALGWLCFSNRSCLLGLFRWLVALLTRAALISGIPEAYPFHSTPACFFRSVHFAKFHVAR